jgi:NADH dehydrogenase
VTANGAAVSSPPHVVIVGGGFGGLEAAKALRKAPVRVTLYDRMNYHLFQPLLYQVALAGLSPNEIAMPIRSILSRQKNTEVVLAEVSRIDLPGRRVHFSDGTDTTYDYLVVSAGARTNYYGHDDWVRVAPSLKDLNDALEIRRRVLMAMELADREADPVRRACLLTFVVIGGGPTGVELAGAIADLSRDILARDFRNATPETTRVVLLEMSGRILAPFHERLSASAVKQLQELGVEVRTGARVTAISDKGVHLGEELIQSSTVLWTAGVRPNDLTLSLGAPLDRGGRVLVQQDCSVPAHSEAFVIGDMACFVPAPGEAPLPGISPVAMQQGRRAARNIARSLEGKPRQPFVYVDKGFMATIGRARAVAQLRGLKLTGFVAWLAWIFVHLWYLVGFRNRLFVFADWCWSYLTARHGARLITAPPVPPPSAAGHQQQGETPHTGDLARPS